MEIIKDFQILTFHNYDRDLYQKICDVVRTQSLDLPAWQCDAKLATDFFGLNYYSHSHLKFKFDSYEFFENKFFNDDIMTDMPYAIYPEGLYRAIKKVNRLNKPIIITENGIADAKDDRRSLFIERYIYAMSKAISEGANVEGYFYWSLMDNFEWAEGYDMRFGLYAVDFNTQKRTLRNGAKKFINIINKSK